MKKAKPTPTQEEFNKAIQDSGQTNTRVLEIKNRIAHIRERLEEGFIEGDYPSAVGDGL
jgi:hypothetical protein